MKRVYKVWVSLSVIAACATASAYTIDTGLIAFVQPNGAEFKGRQWSEGYAVNSRTEDGFEFIKDPGGHYYYARLGAQGDFVSSGVKVGIDDPYAHGIPKGLMRTAPRRAEIQDAFQRSANGNRKAAGKLATTQVAPPSTITLGIVLVEFSDIKGSSYAETDYESMFFGSSYTGNSHPDGQTVWGSIAAYWTQMSGGTVTITDDPVQGGRSGGILNPVYSGAPSWVPLAENKAHYHTTFTMNGFRAVARAAAANMGINTATSSTYRIAYVYAGNLYDQTPTAWPPSGCGNCGLTPHAILGGNEYLYSELRDSNHATDARNCESSGCATTPVFAHIGSHVHEIGHMFGLEHPHDSNGPVDVDFWSPIQSGDKAGGNIGSAPIALAPEEMRDLGFASFTQLSGRRDELTFTPGTYYQIDYGPGRFVIEHRTGGGIFNNYLWKDPWSGSGLLLWFTDVNASGADDRNQSLIAADGDPDNAADMFGDMFPGNESVTDINDDTTPKPSDGTGISPSATTLFALADITNNASSTTVDVFDNHYSDTPTVIDINTAEAQKTSVNFTWDAHGSNPTHYIYYGAQPNSYDQLATVSSGNTSHVLASLTNDTRYYARINSSVPFSNIPHACRSDYDDDGGNIDFFDFFIWADYVDTQVTSDALQRYDLSGNGYIDESTDLEPLFMADFNKLCSAIPKGIVDDPVAARNSLAQGVVSVSRGKTSVLVDLEVANGSEIAGFGAVIEYDPRALRFVEATDSRGILMKKPGKVVRLLKNEPGALFVGAAARRDHGRLSASGLLSQLHFEVLSEPEGALPVEVRELLVADADKRVNRLLGQPRIAKALDEIGLGVAPNPSNPASVVSFALPQASVVELSIFNQLGQHVATLIDGQLKSSGSYRVEWNGRDAHGREAASGIYLVHLKLDEKIHKQKLTLVR